MGSLMIRVAQDPESDKCLVYVDVLDDAKLKEFFHLMCAAEYLSYLVATKSNMGFEAALDAVSAGAQTWRTIAKKESG